MNHFLHSPEPRSSWSRILLVMLTAVLIGVGAGAESIVNSKHNLSVTGPGPIHAATETEVCIFCHTPHNATSEAPLWNRFSSGVFYNPYSSSTTKASIGQPTGSSRLCLSCHDGTVALGLVRSRTSPIAFSGGVFNMPPGRSRLGTDLADDHPISFRYDTQLASDNGELVDPASLIADVRLDFRGELQCTSCHDPHDDRYGDFLVRDNQESALCLTCHDPTYWQGSIHRSSVATWNSNGVDPWPHTEEITVLENGCASCHSPHEAGTPERLLNYAGEEQNCFPCHNGNVADQNVESEFDKLSAHEVDATVGVHDPTENLVDSPRHVECVDCHNPHAADDNPVPPTGLAGALRGLAGITSTGAEILPIQQEYELCFRCHADSLDRGGARVNRQFPETNTRTEFASGNASYHPVVTMGQNPDVPSLINPYTTSSLIACTDCHNNNAGPGAGGSGPRGPHGSDFRPILERRLDLSDQAGGGPAEAELCYKCHSSASIMGDESFSEHARHIDEGIACASCHDAHGVSRNTHLINFNVDVAQPFNGQLEFLDQGAFAGQCTLTCHGEEHDAISYPEN